MSKPLQLDKSFPSHLRAFLKAKDLSKNAFCTAYAISDYTMNSLLDGNTANLQQSTLDKLAPVMKDKLWPKSAAKAPKKIPKKKLETLGFRLTRNTQHLPADVASPDIYQVTSVINKPSVAVAEEKATCLDYKQFVDNAPYVPRNLILFITRYPSTMPKAQCDAWKSLIETKVVQFDGLTSGHVVSFDADADVYVTVPFAQRPRMTVAEKLDKPVRRLLDQYYRSYVEGRSGDRVRADGMIILAVEPNTTGLVALDAWSIEGIVFSNTGRLPAKRDITAALSEVPPHEVHLYSTINQSPAIMDQAQSLLNKLNSPAFNLS